jgi:hypothetical protein
MSSAHLAGAIFSSPASLVWQAIVLFSFLPAQVIVFLITLKNILFFPPSVLFAIPIVFPTLVACQGYKQICQERASAGLRLPAVSVTTAALQAGAVMAQQDTFFSALFEGKWPKQFFVSGASSFVGQQWVPHSWQTQSCFLKRGVLFFSQANCLMRIP